MHSSYTKSPKFAIAFDDDHSVSHAGLLLLDQLSISLGIQDAANELVDLGGRPGGANPGRKLLTLIESLVIGGDCIDDSDILRSGATEKVLSHDVMAPSTLGTFLRAFTFGNIRQLDKLSELIMTRAWNSAAALKDGPMTIDVDSTICEVYGKKKEGSSYGYTKELCQHPLLSTRAETGEVLHVRHRKGSAHTGRGAQRFISETISRVRRA